MIEEIKKTLLATADKLRANKDAAESNHVVLGLIFLKYISDTLKTRSTELRERFIDPQDEYHLPDADGVSLVRERLPFQTLLPRLTSGQLRLPPAEALYEEAAA